MYIYTETAGVKFYQVFSSQEKIWIQPSARCSAFLSGFGLPEVLILAAVCSYVLQGCDQPWQDFAQCKFEAHGARVLLVSIGGAGIIVQRADHSSLQVGLTSFENVVAALAEVTFHKILEIHRRPPQDIQHGFHA